MSVVAASSPKWHLTVGLDQAGGVLEIAARAIEAILAVTARVSTAVLMQGSLQQRFPARAVHPENVIPLSFRRVDNSPPDRQGRAFGRPGGPPSPSA